MQPEKLPTEDGYSSNFHSSMEAFLGNLTWRAVHAILELPSAESSPLKISKMLDISVEEVMQALEGLTGLGLVKMNDGKFVPCQQKFMIPLQNIETADQIEKHVSVSRQILNTLDAKDSPIFTKSVMVSNKKLMNELEDKIKELLLEYDNKAQAEGVENDGVYAITLTGSKLTQAGL